jgi:hypothetical protein
VAELVVLVGVVESFIVEILDVVVGLTALLDVVLVLELELVTPLDDTVFDTEDVVGVIVELVKLDDKGPARQ